MSQVLKFAAIFQKRAQHQLIDVDPVQITDYTNTVLQVATKALQELNIPNAYAIVNVDKRSNKGYDVEVNADNYYNASGAWVKPSDIYNKIWGALSEYFSMDPTITFNVKVPIDQDKMIPDSPGPNV